MDTAMQITQRQKYEMEGQLSKLVRHWKRIAKEIGKDGSRMPSSLDDFSREEAGRILGFLATVH
jgi:hypothetical protein